MLFGSEDLVRRIERAERQILVDAFALARERLGDAAFLLEVGEDGLACFTESGSPLNKVCALGIDGPPDERAFEAVEAAYLERGEPVRCEVATLADPGTGRFLTERGYRLVGFENVLGCALPAAALSLAPEGLSVRESPPEDFDSWLDACVAGFAVPDTQGLASDESFDTEVLRRIMGDFVRAPGMLRYDAVRDGERVGCGTLRVFEGIAQLCGASTLPAHRRRGAQTLLLAERLADAYRRGCELATVTTQPGSKSQENVQRRGFELLYTRAVLVREPAAD